MHATDHRCLDRPDLVQVLMVNKERVTLPIDELGEQCMQHVCTSVVTADDLWAPSSVDVDRFPLD